MTNIFKLLLKIGITIQSDGKYQQGVSMVEQEETGIRNHRDIITSSKI